MQPYRRQYRLALLWLLVLRLEPRFAPASASGKSRQLMILSLLVVILQITLGGWTSTNYAAQCSATSADAHYDSVGFTTTGMKMP